MGDWGVRGYGDMFGFHDIWGGGGDGDDERIFPPGKPSTIKEVEERLLSVVRELCADLSVPKNGSEDDSPWTNDCLRGLG